MQDRICPLGKLDRRFLRRAQRIPRGYYWRRYRRLRLGSLKLWPLSLLTAIRRGLLFFSTFGLSSRHRISFPLLRSLALDCFGIRDSSWLRHAPHNHPCLFPEHGSRLFGFVRCQLGQLLPLEFLSLVQFHATVCDILVIRRQSIHSQSPERHPLLAGVRVDRRHRHSPLKHPPLVLCLFLRSFEGIDASSERG